MDKILLLEDDLSLIDGLKYTLKKNGFSIDIARTIKEAEEKIKNLNEYSLLLLDVTLPDGSGFDICEKVRNSGSMVPIIFLTAMDEEMNIIRGLDTGADDYITKPFKVGELCSRIRAVFRRMSMQSESNEINCNGITINSESHEVAFKGRKLNFTAAEYKLLYLLVKNAGITLSRTRILDELWDNAGDFVDDNTVSVYIRRLREKIEENPSKPEYLLTVRGFGYQWKK